MGLRHLPIQTRHNDRGCAEVFNDTWGHLSPQKNTSYKGNIRFTLTDHSHYGSQPIIITYDFGSLEGPYIHDELFDYVNEIDTSNLIEGSIYEMNLTFRNYRFYSSKPKLMLP